MSSSNGMDREYKHAIEYYVAMKKDEAQLHISTWVNLTKHCIAKVCYCKIHTEQLLSLKLNMKSKILFMEICLFMEMHIYSKTINF